MKIKVILNVNSGRKLLPYLDKDFLEIAKIGHIVSIEKVSDLKSINEALQDIDKYDLLICAGGDGTASICANYSIKYQIPLYVYPIGSGNDFANYLKMKPEINYLIQLIERFAINEVNTIKINDQLSSLTITCFGFEAKVNRTALKLPRFLGSFKYTLATFISLLGKHWESLVIESDNIKEKGDYCLAIVANSPSFGGGMKVSNKANLYSDFMYLILVNKVNKLKLIFLFILLLMGKHYNRKEFREYPIRTVKISKTDGVLKGQSDGDSLPSGNLELVLNPKSLRVLAHE